MSDSEKLNFSFQSHVRFDPAVADGYMKHYVPIPDDVGNAIEEAGHKHVEGTLDDHPFRRSLQVRPNGAYCLKFGMTWLKQHDLPIDSEIIVELFPDPDPDRVDVPDELATALEANPALEHVWEMLAPSKRKTMVYDILRAKRQETRQRRAQKVMDELRKIVENR